jgi:hypothetical protein
MTGDGRRRRGWEALTTPRTIPRAILAGWLTLLASVAVSFAFIVANGGLTLSVAGAPTAAASSPPPGIAGASAGAVPSAETSASSNPTAHATSTAAPSRSPGPPSPRPSPRPSPTPRATPRPASGSLGPSASRLAVLSPCPDAASCYIYTIRSGDNLFSIAAWFGVRYSTVLAMNPGLSSTVIRAGQRIRIPTPTR